MKKGIIIGISVAVLLGLGGVYWATRPHMPSVTPPVIITPTSTATTTPTTVATSTPVLVLPTSTRDIPMHPETSGWQTFSNAAVGFSFRHPSGWKLDDNLSVKSCCLDLYNVAVVTHSGPGLASGIMDAQFIYQAYPSTTSETDYLKLLIKGNADTEMGTPVDFASIQSSIVNLRNQYGLAMIYFKGRDGEDWYVLPKKPDYSEVLLITVHDPDPEFEGVLSTFRFTK